MLPSAASVLIVEGVLWLLILLRVSRGSGKSPEKDRLRSPGLLPSSVFILCRSGSSKRMDWDGEAPLSAMESPVSLLLLLGRSKGSEAGRWTGGDRPSLLSSGFPLVTVSKGPLSSCSLSLGLNLYWLPDSLPDMGEDMPDLVLEKLSAEVEVGLDPVDSGLLNPAKF